MERLHGQCTYMNRGNDCFFDNNLSHCGLTLSMLIPLGSGAELWRHQKLPWYPLTFNLFFLSSQLKKTIYRFLSNFVFVLGWAPPYIRYLWYSFSFWAGFLPKSGIDLSIVAEIENKICSSFPLAPARLSSLFSKTRQPSPTLFDACRLRHDTATVDSPDGPRRKLLSG